jgi:hypothetical protein
MKVYALQELILLLPMLTKVANLLDGDCFRQSIQLNEIMASTKDIGCC